MNTRTDKLPDENTERDAKELRKTLIEYDETPIEGWIKNAGKKLKKQ